MPRWFLSYHSPDRDAGGAAQGRDRAQGPGVARLLRADEPARRRRLDRPTRRRNSPKPTPSFCSSAKHGVGKWQVPEYDEALDRWVKSGRTFPLIVVLLEGQTAPGLPFLRQLHWIVTPDPASEKDVARIFDAASGGGARPPELWRYASPYRGLEAMEEKDSDYFFGRDAGNGRGARGARRAQGRLPVLIGNSGVGKSSLAQAGVLAALKRQAWPERCARVQRLAGGRFRTAGDGAFSR